MRTEHVLWTSPDADGCQGDAGQERLTKDEDHSSGSEQTNWALQRMRDC